MKVIIPSAGTGTRLRPHTYTIPKSLIHVAGKPILGHILDRIAVYKPETIVLIIGNMGEAIIEYVKNNYSFNFEFIKQEEQMGLGHAVALARDAIKTGATLIMLGDTIIDWATYFEDKTESFIGVKKVDEPRRYGIVEVGPDGYVARVVEKPAEPVSDLAIVGIYYLTNFELLSNALQELINKDIRTRGEYQLTDALQILITRGFRFKPITVENWFDCGNVQSLITANRYLLNQRHHCRTYADSVIIPPCYIDDTAQIQNSIVGPYVSIGAGVKIDSSIIKESIINPFAQIEKSILTDTIIGQRATVRGSFKKLNVGDSSEMEST
ncbi:MAG: sugar phosphate nucleotidyltransferase [candidate division WOR-3 bacterium]